MIMKSQGKIFLADERGRKLGSSSQSYSTFNFEDYFNPFKHSFGNIYALNDFMLAGSASQSIKVPEGFYVVLLPVSGAISYSDSSVQNKLIVAGQAQVIVAGVDTDIEIRNPFRNEVVNFIHLLIKSDKPSLSKAIYLSTYDDVNRFRNRMVRVFPGISDTTCSVFSMQIGKFSGRGEAIYTVKQNSKGFFGFVLDGVFEVEGRLLHARDGLALWDIEKVEMEALSNGALILIVETEDCLDEKV
jgi:quercetin 2,3-dioxygenase